MSSFKLFSSKLSYSTPKNHESNCSKISREHNKNNLVKLLTYQILREHRSATESWTNFKFSFFCRTAWSSNARKSRRKWNFLDETTEKERERKLLLSLQLSTSFHRASLASQHGCGAVKRKNREWMENGSSNDNKDEELPLSSWAQHAELPWCGKSSRLERNISFFYNWHGATRTASKISSIFVWLNENNEMSLAYSQTWEWQETFSLIDAAQLQHLYL